MKRLFFFPSLCVLFLRKSGKLWTLHLKQKKILQATYKDLPKLVTKQLKKNLDNIKLLVSSENTLNISYFLTEGH